MTTIGLTVLLATWGTTILIAYAAGARAAYWRGVARCQHAAGRIHMHVLAHALYGAPLPPVDQDELDAGKKTGPN